MEPILFRPINITEWTSLRESTATFARSRQKRQDSIYRKFPLLRRQDSFYQKFETFLIGGPDDRSGYLEIFNGTTGDMVPICDRQFTRRNAEVVCREKGFETENVYVWVGARWDYNPRLRIVK